MADALYTAGEHIGLPDSRRKTANPPQIASPMALLALAAGSPANDNAGGAAN